MQFGGTSERYGEVRVNAYQAKLSGMIDDVLDWEPNTTKTFLCKVLGLFQESEECPTFVCELTSGHVVSSAVHNVRFMSRRDWLLKKTTVQDSKKEG